MSKPLWQTLVKSAIDTQKEEIGCSECYDHLDEYADLLMAGIPPSEVMELVKQHLRHCPDCTTVFESLLTIISSEDH